jgi:hypothetical protein
MTTTSPRSQKAVSILVRLSMLPFSAALILVTMSTLPVQVIGTSRLVAPDKAVSLVRVYIEGSHPEAPSEAWTDPGGHFTLMAPMDDDFDLLVQRPGCEDHTARDVRWTVSTPPPIRIPACVPLAGAARPQPAPAQTPQAGENGL